MVWRSMEEWQQLAAAGSLSPDYQLYDAARGVWQRAGDFPQLQPYFPGPKPNWPLLGLGLASLAAIIAASSSTAETDRRSYRDNRQSGKKKVFVSFDFDNDKMLKDFI